VTDGAILRFDGRVVLVTGGGQGLGRSHAHLLAERGAAVVVNDLAGADEVVREISAGGGTALAHAGDIATREGADGVVGAALDAYGRLDVVIPNAGILRSADLADTTDALWDEVLGVNLRGAFVVVRAAWRAFVEQEYGRVVLTSSNSGLLGVTGSSAYAASKAALWGLTRVLALEGADLGIHANAVAPMAYTSMSAQSRVAPASWRSGEGDAWAARLAPALVSPVVGWLAHETCSLSGEVLSVAGGRVARFFLGLTPGVVDVDLTVESVRAHEREILSEAGYDVLDRASEESRRLYRRLMP
jgi:NAD(P)-dependent dehydrogenase (short-subunit alcohol dehydrogenase family)